MIRTIQLATIIILSSCETKKVDERLLFFSTRMVMDMDSLVEVESDLLYQGLYSDNFNFKTDTIRFDNGEIYISYLSVVNGCANYSGDIQFKEDSIILELTNERNYACTEQRCDRIVFRIGNIENKRYKIKKW